MTKPQTLAEVAEMSATIDEFSMNIRNFLHEFQAHPDLAPMVARVRKDRSLTLVAQKLRYVTETVTERTSTTGSKP